MLRARTKQRARRPQANEEGTSDDASTLSVDGNDEPRDTEFTAQIPCQTSSVGRVSFLSANACHLLLTAEKAIHLRNLLCNHGWPSLVCITEVDGLMGRPGDDLYQFLRNGTNLCSVYDILWTQRSCEYDGSAPRAGKPGPTGGGVMLMVHKRLQAKATVIPLKLADPTQLQMLNGHLRLWRLDPTKQGVDATVDSRALAEQMHVMCTYVPPKGKQWGRVRPLVFEAMCRAATDLQRHRQSRNSGVTLVLGHPNLKDGNMSVPLTLDSVPATVAFRARMAALQHVSDHRASVHEASNNEEQLLLERLKCKKMGTTDENDQAFVTHMALAGLVPLPGVMSGPQTTTWVNHNCIPGKCKCKRKRSDDSAKNMSAINETGWASSNVVAHALSQGNDGKKWLRYRAQRIEWAPTINHAVVTGHVGLVLEPEGTRSENIAADEPAYPRQPKKAKLPMNLRQRRQMLQRFASEISTLCTQNKPPITTTTVNAWNARIKGMIKEATTIAMTEAQEEEAEDNADKPAPSVLAARRALNTAWASLKRVTRHRQQCQTSTSSPSTVRSNCMSRRASRLQLNQNVRLATRNLGRALVKQQAILLTLELSRAPLKAYKVLHAAASSAGKGEPKPASCLLRDHLNDAKGNVITTNQKEIDRLLVNDRLTTYQIGDLNEACVEAIAESLECVQTVNQKLACELPHLDLSSAVSMQTGNSDAPIEEILVRRPDLRDRLAKARRRLQEARRQSNTNGSDGQKSPDQLTAVQKFEAVRSNHAFAVKALEADLQMSELENVCKLLKDVGPATDGISPVLLRQLFSADDDACEADEDAMGGAAAVSTSNAGDRSSECVERTAEINKLLPNGPTEEILHTLQIMWERGVIPDEDRIHRCLFHHKGKGLDYFCLDSYRGLGIGNLLLKLLSLIMTRRLESFLTATNGLSGLQGGFLPGRGTPEQIFTLSESVRAAIARRHGPNTAPVHLAFLDVKRAYDSLIHPILWQRCIEKGIGGRFLAMLQGIYQGAQARLDVNGDLLPSVPIECGVLQGNPLSPQLFNIYLDPVLRSLEAEGNRVGPFGVPLPHVMPRNHHRPTAHVARDVSTQRDFLPALFFADDGVLIARDIATLQRMVNLVETHMLSVGLALNNSKTEWMIVAPHHWDLNAYDDAVTLALQQPLIVAGRAVNHTNTFKYLGAIINWRWDWTSAWNNALSRAKTQLHMALASGFQHMGTLHTQLTYARSCILSHLDYIAAVAGCGGSPSTAPCVANDAMLTSILRAITGVRFGESTATALRLESGMWDSRTRIDKLLLRCFAKWCAAPMETTHYRAMCLSFESLDDNQANYPEQADSSTQRLHHQPWAQHVLAAAIRFKIPVAQIRQLRLGVVKVQCQMSSYSWTDVPHPDSIEPAAAAVLSRKLQLADAKFRYVLTDPPDDANAELTDGVDMWIVPEDGTPYDELFLRWSKSLGQPTALRNATYAALQRKGNACRNTTTQSFLNACRRGLTGYKTLQRYANLMTGSKLQPYWYIADARAARRLLQVRLDAASNEGNVRRRVFNATAKVRHLERLEEPLRACYLCNAVHTDVPNVYMPETIEHVLLKCPAYDEQRNLVQELVRQVVESDESLKLFKKARVSPPQFPLSDAALLTVLRLCTTPAPAPLLSQMHVGLVLIPDSPPGASHQTRATVRQQNQRRAERMRASPQYDIDHAATRETASWLRVLTDNWADRVRYPWLAPPDNSPGCRVGTYVAKFCQMVFSMRRRLLHDDEHRDHFLRRDRDPEPT